jgi:hypothetical protein
MSATKLLVILALVALGLGLAAAGFYIAHIDDAPGAALIGAVLMVAALTGAVKTARSRS